MYIDPPGVGYSVGPTINPTDTANYYTDNKVVGHLYDALIKWFKDFPEYKNLDLYIGGSGYGGVYVNLIFI